MATYTPGEPNETIFVRNIHRRATLEELQAIFGAVFPSDTAAAQYGWLVGSSFATAITDVWLTVAAGAWS